MGINVSYVTCSVRIASKSRQSDSLSVPQCTQCSSLLSESKQGPWWYNSCGMNRILTMVVYLCRKVMAMGLPSPMSSRAPRLGLDPSPL